MLFQKAVPVWLAGEEKKLNSNCIFFLDFKKAENARLLITASCFYKAYLNGKLLAFGPARTAHGYARVDELLLSNQRDDNTLCVIAAGYNTLSFWSLDQSAFLQAEIVCDGSPLYYTGRDFKVREYDERLRKVSRFSYQRSFTESYHFDVAPIDVLLGKDKKVLTVPKEVEGLKVIERNTDYPKYEPLYSAVKEAGSFVYDESKKAYRDRYMSIQALKIFPTEEWESNPSDFVSRLKYGKYDISDGLFPDTLKGGEYAVYDFGTAETGFFELSLKAEEKSRVMLIFDELDLEEDKTKPMNICFSRNTCVNIVEYSLEAGAFMHESFEPYTARFVKLIVVSGSVSYANIRLINFGNPDTDRFFFKCPDEKLCGIVDAAKRTFCHNAVDLLTDCPSRERAGWLCDAWFSSRAEKLLTGKNLVEHDFLQNYELAPQLPYLPEGMVGMCYPADFEDSTFIPNWAMWYIVEVYDSLLRNPDSDIAQRSEKKVRGILGYFDTLVNPDGLLEDLKSWIFVEWSKANDGEFIRGVNYPSNMLWAYALECAGKMYGDEKYLEKSRKAKDMIRAQSFNGEFFEDNRVRENGELVQTGHITETCQYYAFFCGIATPERYPELFRTLVEKFGAARDAGKVYPNVYPSNAFIGNYLRLIMLASYGYKERISDECVLFFDKMAKRTGTLWEHSGAYASLDHGFASYAANLIVDYTSGFEGCRGKELVFGKAASDIDCEIHVPVGDDRLVFIRRGGTEKILPPKGYTVVRK